MIRITKPGKEDKLMVGTCEMCGCEVECDKRDTVQGQRGQTQVNIWFIECPGCNNTALYVKEKE